MGQTIKNKITYDLSDDASDFFSIPELDDKKELDYDYKLLRAKIYKIDIDQDEKADIINKINSLTINRSFKEQEKIIKEINEFRDKYGL